MSKLVTMNFNRTKHLLYLTLITSFFLFIFFIAINTTFFWTKENWYKPSTKNNKYLLDINNHKFMVPRNYIWSYNKISHDRVYSPSFHVLYPRMEPKTERNKTAFEQPGWSEGKLISFIFIKSNQSKSVSQIIKHELASWTIKDSRKKIGDLEIYDSTIDGNEFILKPFPNNEKRYFKCSKEIYVPFPSCNTRFHLNSDIIVQVTFSRKQLPNWDTIELSLRSLISSFST
ncbi:hypothetical protein H0A36_27310 [Endozoicomonas sp. SM1973]|uniref:Uncharacterized protein n=1 Tax=Spartinivicinus marinus TaxID=2994442 RepID=A0A853IGS2_9GAMM|nr:hypothetical protein [Spartinivicinus marinus]MCX4025368.1 hypothetical protein [Spartinivicinus marinus]NYZ69728.1 hypothetical protein [Spartinivicinus marinus]